MEQRRSRASVLCSSHINQAIHSILAFAIVWPDLELNDLISRGVKPVGPQDKIDIYRSKVTTPSLTLEDLFNMNPSFRKTVQSRPPPPPDKAKAIIEKSVEEQQEQLLSPWMSEEDLNICKEFEHSDFELN